MENDCHNQETDEKEEKENSKRKPKLFFSLNVNKHY